MASRKEVQYNIYTSTAIKFKQQMNELIDVAYEGHPQIQQFKRFKVTCLAKKSVTALADCCYQEDGSALIRLHNIEGYSWENIYVSLIHEVAHHIDHCVRGRSGHDTPFYDIHVRLLFAAFDMKLMEQEHVLDWTRSQAGNRTKLAYLVKEYNSFLMKEKINPVIVFLNVKSDFNNILKRNNYKWNPGRKLWTKLIPGDGIPTELSFLEQVGIGKEEVFLMPRYYKPHEVEYKKGRVTVFIRRAFNAKEELKAIGYSWNGIGKHWEKEIDEDTLSAELECLKSLGLDKEVVYKKSGAVLSRIGHTIKAYTNLEKSNSEFLKPFGYYWNQVTSTWDKDIDGDEILEEEKNMLLENGVYKIKII